MSTLHIEHPISDFVTWKAAFDRAAPLRVKGHVRSYDIHQPVDDPDYVIVRLEFDDEGAAHAFLTTLEQLWKNPEATPALRGVPRARILERREQA
jgi:ribosomal protein L35AE/L33A